MTSTKIDQFCNLHPIHPQTLTIDLLLENNRTCRHVTNLKTHHPLPYGRHKCMFPYTIAISCSRAPGCHVNLFHRLSVDQ